MALTSNRVYVSPHHIGYWEGMGYATSSLIRIFLGRRSDIKPIFYGTLFQAGIKDFLIDAKMDKYVPDAAFIQSRTELIPENTSDNDRKVITGMFAAYLPDYHQRNDQYSDVWTLEYFLGDLFVALRENVGIASVSVPEPETYRGILPAELLMPISSLLSSIQTHGSAGPVPRFLMERTQIQDLEEIFKGNDFGAYSDAQAQLADDSQPPLKALSRARSLAATVQEKYLNRIKLSRMGLSMLPVVPKLVDSVFGKLPGRIAEYFAKVAEPLLDQRRRIVIYDCSSIRDEILMNTLLYVYKNKDADHIVKERVEEYEREKEAEKQKKG